VVVPPGIADQVVAEGGRVTFARFMDLALTHPTQGYYSSSETLMGPRGHFSTAPLLSPEFNQTHARLVVELVVAVASPVAIEDAAPAEGLPGSVSLVELGGGEGQSAVAVLDLLARERPDLKSRVTYTIVEVGEGLRARQRGALARAIADGWRVAWAPSLTDAVTAVNMAPVVAVGNEFLDALPVHLVDVRGDRCREAWVEVVGDSADTGEGAAPGGGAGVREIWDFVGPETAAELSALFGTEDALALRPLSRDGFIEVRPVVGGVMRQLGAQAAPSCLLTLDYGHWFGMADPSLPGGAGSPGAASSPAAYRRTMRGYYRHQLVSDPYARVGGQDLTADVDFRALHLHGRAAGYETVLYTTVAAMLRGDSGAERLALLGQKAAGSLEIDRRATVLRALLDDHEVGGAFKVMLQVRG
jgi:SAM-dependent MidA family methyltransferase